MGGQASKGGRFSAIETAWLLRISRGAFNPVSIPDLSALQRRDDAAWECAHNWLWPVARQVAQRTLGSILPDAVDDTAIEALEQVVEKISTLHSVEELKPLTASIAHNLAVTRLREHSTQKRGQGQTQSLDAVNADGEPLHDPPAPESPLNAVEQNEFPGFLGQLLKVLKPEPRGLITDYLLGGLNYQQLAEKYSRPIGSIGTTMKRGLESIRKAIESCPKLRNEVQSYLQSTQ